MDNFLVYYNTPARTLIAPWTAFVSPLVSACMRIWNKSGHASGQSQCAMAETAYATLDRTLLIDSLRPDGRIFLISSLDWNEDVR